MYDASPKQLQRRKISLATSLAVVGIFVVTTAALSQPFPRPLSLWFGFAIAMAYLGWQAVEVNDRLLMSPTIMVIMTAAVVFGRSSAILGATALAAVSAPSVLDLRERRWFQPIANGGILVIVTAISTAILSALLPDAYGTGTLWQIAVAAGFAAAIHGVLNYQLVLFGVRQVFGRRQVRPWSNLAALIVPYVGMGFLGGLLGAAYHLVGTATLPLIFIVFFVGHMTFSSYAQLREAQESTLRGFVKALEAKDLYTRGHTERVAYFSEIIGQELGFNGTQLEKLRWAALIHDVGKLAVPRDLIRKRARLTAEEFAQMQAHVHLVEDLLAEVDFLQPMVAIAANHHVHFDGNGYSGTNHEHNSAPPIEARILAVADSFDAMTSTRSYRVALTQQYAFDELRDNSGSQFDPVVVDALTRALARRHERYGSPDVADEAEARRRAEGVTVDG